MKKQDRCPKCGSTDLTVAEEKKKIHIQKPEKIILYILAAIFGLAAIRRLFSAEFDLSFWLNVGAFALFFVWANSIKFKRKTIKINRYTCNTCGHQWTRRIPKENNEDDLD